MLAPGTEVVVRAERLWDGAAEEVFEGMDVRVREGRIVEMNPGLRPSTPAGTVIDLPHRTLLPGLIDCHVHIIDEALDTEPLGYQVIRAVPVLQDLLLRGFTTIRDLGSADQPLNVSLKRAVSEGTILGPRMIVAPNMISAHGGHGDKEPGLGERYGLEVGTVADGQEAILRVVREQARSGADWIKYAASGGFSSPSDGLADVGYTQQEMNLLVAAATDRQLPVAAHAFGDEAVRRALLAGVRSVEHACLTGPETLSLIAEQGTWLVPTQYAQVYFLDRLENEEFWEGRPAHLREAFRRHADQLRHHFPLVAASGVRIAFGTDAGVFPHAENWREFTTLVDHGFTPLQTLRAATSEAAELLGLTGLGRIATGLTADLAAVLGNPLEDIRHMGQVDFVMKEGLVHRTPQGLSHEPLRADTSVSARRHY